MSTPGFVPPAKQEGFEGMPGETDFLAEQNRQLDIAVKTRLAEQIDAITREALPAPDEYVINRMTTGLQGVIESNGFDRGLVSITPPTQKNVATQGIDLAFNIARAAKQDGKNPVEAATNLANEIVGLDGVASSETVGPFVNLGLDFQELAPQIVNEVAMFGDRYGHFRKGAPEIVVIDYSSPNVAKNMTLAHLRSTIIGHSLAKIQHAVGNIPFSVNHVGDWGTQFGSIIYQYGQEMAADSEAFQAEIAADPTAALMRVYRKFNDNEKGDPVAADSAREIFLRLEQGDPELVELWSQFREWSLRDFGPVYDRLRVSFDAIQGESFYEDRMGPAIQEALAQDVLQLNDEGAIVFPSQPLTDPTTGAVNERVMLGHDGLPQDEIVLKPTGGTVYLTRDLAAIRYRSEELGADRILYVIGKEQQAHCLKLFAMADQLGQVALGGAEHISFGHLNVDGRKMKSRAGKVALLNTPMVAIIFY